MTTSAAPNISVVILNYNGKDFVADCIDSLIGQNFRDFEVIVVDNGSTDGSAALLQDRYAEQIRFIGLQNNTGFAEGNNIGISVATGQYVALLNNDAVAAPEWLSELSAAAARSDATFGMWACKILFFDHRDVIDTAGHLIYPDGLNRGRGKNEKDTGQYDQEEEVFFPSGCAALFRKSMLDEIGAFDPDFFAYGDDTDLGIKARRAGWRCLYVPDAVVYHRSSATAGRYSEFKAYLVERNRVWVLAKHFPACSIVLSIFYTLLRFLFQAYGALTGRGAAGRFVESMSRLALLSVLIRAYRDAFWGLPSMLHKRRAFRQRVRTTSRDFHVWLKKYKISAYDIAMKD